jgi:hypothetical protein
VDRRTRHLGSPYVPEPIACQSAGEEDDGGGVEEGLCGGDGCLEILGHSSVSVDQAKKRSTTQRLGYRPRLPRELERPRAEFLRELGRVDKSDPDTHCSEQYESSKALDEFVIARGDAA